MEKKHWLVCLYGENNQIEGIQLLKNLTDEEAFEASAPIVAGAHHGSYTEYGLKEAAQVVTVLMRKHGLKGTPRPIQAIDDSLFPEGARFTVTIDSNFRGHDNQVRAISQEAEQFLIITGFTDEITAYAEDFTKMDLPESFPPFRKQMSPSFPPFERGRLIGDRQFFEGIELYTERYPRQDEIAPAKAPYDLSKIDFSKFGKFELPEEFKLKTNNWLARVFDESHQIVNEFVIKGLTECGANFSAILTAGPDRDLEIVEFGSAEAIEVVNFLLKKHGVAGDAKFTIGPIEKPGVNDLTIVMANYEDGADPEAVKKVIEEGHRSFVAIIFPKLLGKE